MGHESQKTRKRLENGRPGRRRLAIALGAALTVVGSGLLLADPTSMSFGTGVGAFGEGARSRSAFAEADPTTGEMTYDYPFELPTARGRPQPELALRYRSSARDREAGYGWSLDLPSIERRPLSGAPAFLANGLPAGEERYAFNGQPLIRICEAANAGCAGSHPLWADGWAYYRLQNEGLFARFYRSANHKSWRVQLKGGVLLHLGAHAPDPNFSLDPASEQLSPAIEVDADNPAAVVRYRLLYFTRL